MAGKIAVEYYVQHHTGKLFIWNQFCGADIRARYGMPQRRMLVTITKRLRNNTVLRTTKHNFDKYWKNQQLYQHGKSLQKWQK